MGGGRQEGTVREEGGETVVCKMNFKKFKNKT